MKKIKSKLLIIASALLLSACNGSFAPKDAVVSTPTIEPDDIEYKEVKKADLRKPDFTLADVNEEEEEEEETLDNVDKVVLHYVNDDNKCKGAGTSGRAFYVWVPGIDGQEYSDESNPGVVEYSADGGMMTITIDMKNDPKFTPFFGSATIMYIIKWKMESPANLNWGGQSEDVELRFATFPPVNGVVEVWSTPAAGGGIAQFATEAETKVDGVKLAYFTDFKTISCTLTDNATNVAYDMYAFDETYYKVKAKNRAAIKKNYLVKSGTATSKSFDIKLTYNAHINVVYSIESYDTSSTSGLKKTIFISFEKLYDNQRFIELYTNPNKSVTDLGMTYTPTETTFKVWSPIAANMSVMLYDTDTTAAYGGTDKAKGYHMFYTPGGIWELTIEGDLKGKYYNFSVDTWTTTGVTLDPYAKACGANGLRGLVYDKNETNPDGWNSFSVPSISTPQDLTIYEVHMADFTGDESWISNNGNARGTYNAFVESGTTYTANDVNGTPRTVSTGFDHLKELGIGAVQLVPVFDSDNDEINNKKYNWGYNPLNYNCVEGVYSSDPHDGLARIREFKNMVNELSKAGMRTIMDVVYNHVSSPSASCFNKLMPRYYFRYDENGELCDGSGCHNEFKSEAIMARKFIVDSISWWASEYNIKGFRFDLMGLLDVETMRAVKKACYKIDPSIYLYGEGWDAAGFHGGWDYENSLQSIPATAKWDSNNVYTQLYDGPDQQECWLGGFNDKGRDIIRGGNDIDGYNGNHKPNWGFIQKGSDDMPEESWKTGLEQTIWGERADGQGGNPCQTVNYVSCHDNWTLRDQLYYTLGNPNGQSLDDQRPWGWDIVHGVEEAEAIVFASNAPAFMLGGEEILRTKDVSFASAADQEKIPADSYETDMYGHKLSHNSYNSPIEVNSFKWGNKIKVEFDTKNGVTDVVDMYNENMTKKFNDMIKLHKEMPKFGYGHNKYETSTGSKVQNLSWYGSWTYNDHGAVAVQYDEYFIYLAARNFAYFKDTNIPTWTKKLYAGNEIIYDSGDGQSLNLGTPEGRGLAMAVYLRK